MTKEERIQKVNALGLLTGDQIYLLEEMGFFTAPASATHHGNYEGGLFDHSWAVMESLVDITNNMGLKWKNARSPFIVGLFHDLCKHDQYIEDWDGEYDYNDPLILKGHGEKSVMLLSQFFMNKKPKCRESSLPKATQGFELGSV